MNHHKFAQDILNWVSLNPEMWQQIQFECTAKCIDNTHYVYKEELECEVLKHIMFSE